MNQVKCCILAAIIAVPPVTSECFARSDITRAQSSPPSAQFFERGVPPVSFDGPACEFKDLPRARKIDKEWEKTTDALSQRRADVVLFNAGNAIRLLETCGGLGEADLLLLARLYVLEARAYSSLGRISQAVAPLDRFSKIYERLLALALRKLSEREASGYYVNSIALSRVALTLLSHTRDPSAARVALQILASRNGRLMEMAGERARIYRRSGPLGAEVAQMRSKQIGLVLRGDFRSAEREASLLSEEVDRIGLQLLVESGAIKNRTLQPLIDVANIQAGIDQREAVIVYGVVMSDYDPFEGPLTEATSYAAWLITRDRVVSLGVVGDSRVIDKQVQMHVYHIKTGSPTDASLPRTLLPDGWIGPEVERLRILPAGGLFELPFASLVRADGRPWWQVARISYETYLRDAARIKSSSGPRSPPAVFGVNMQIAESEAGVYDTLSRPNTLTWRFDRLKHAEAEAGTISRILRVWPERAFIGKAGTEAAVKSLAGPSILHIATHGGNIPDDLRFLAMGTAGPAKKSFGGPKPVAIRPASNFGHTYLALSEYPRVNVAGGEDGVLSDYEVLSLDLDGTLLAVASACSTGLGYQLNDEGIYSMRAALSLAGARAQLVSLWAVDDEMSRAFMEKYYGYLQKGMGAVDAFFATQSDFGRMSNSRRMPGWLAFTISGENVSMTGHGMATNRSNGTYGGAHGDGGGDRRASPAVR